MANRQQKLWYTFFKNVTIKMNHLQQYYGSVLPTLPILKVAKLFGRKCQYAKHFGSKMGKVGKTFQCPIYALLHSNGFFSYFLGSKIRLVTLDLAMDLLKGMVLSENKSYMADTHFAELEGIREESTLLLRNFYKVILTKKV